MNTWTAIVASLLGVIVGGGLSWLSARSQSKRDERREKRKHILAKLEELHEVISAYRHEFNLLTSDRFAVASGAAGWYEKESKPLPKEKLRMLVGFYASDLVSFLERVEQAGNEQRAVALQCASIHRESEPARSQLVGALMEKQQQTDLACEAMQKQIVLLSKKYL